MAISFMLKLSVFTALAGCSTTTERMRGSDDDAEYSGSGGTAGGGAAGGNGGTGGSPRLDGSGGIDKNAGTGGSDAAGGGGGATGTDGGVDRGGGGTDARAPSDDGVLGGNDGGPSSEWIGGPSRCTGAGHLVCLDFENGIGSGWSASGAATTDAVHVARGQGALHIKGVGSIKATLPANGGKIWGRVFLWFAKTYPLPRTNSSLVNTKAGGSDYRVMMRRASFAAHNWDGTEHVSECHADVNCSADARARAAIPIEKWTCVEWFFDGASGRPAEIYQQGVRLEFSDYNPGWPKATSFSTMQIGNIPWHNEQVEMWVDEVALDTKRIGCDR